MVSPFQRIALISVLAFSTALAGCEKKADNKQDEVIARYNGGEVTRSAIDEQLHEMAGGEASSAINFDKLDANMQEAIVREIAARQLVSAGAEKAGIEKDKDIQKAVKDFTNQLVRREYIKRQAKATITEADLRARYDELIKDVKGQEEIHAYHILVKTRAEADEVLAKIRAGASFEKLANAHSLDSMNKARGGDLGYFVRGQMVKEFENAAFALKKGEISSPVKTTFGWHIIKIEDRREAKPPSFESIKDRIENDLMQGAVQKYIIKLIEDANIKLVKAEEKKAEEKKAEAKKDEVKKDGEGKK